MSEKEQWLGEEQDSSWDSDEQFTFNPIYPAAPALQKHIRTGKLAWRAHRTGMWVVEIFSARGGGSSPP